MQIWRKVPSLILGEGLGMGVLFVQNEGGLSWETTLSEGS